VDRWCWWLSGGCFAHFGRGERVVIALVLHWYALVLLGIRSWVYCGSRGRFGAKQGRRFEVQKAEDSAWKVLKIRRAKWWMSRVSCAKCQKILGAKWLVIRGMSW
jgi:hypothetical protein